MWALLSLTLIVLSAGCAAKVRLDRPWIETRTAHFTITTDMRPAKAEALAEEMETFRAAILHFVNVESLRATIPTRIFVFDRAGSYAAFRPSANAGGYFLPTMRANLVVLVDSRGLGSDYTFKHEYIHFLLRNRSRIQYPVWYNEGFSELFSTVATEDGMVVMGELSEPRISQLRHSDWIPMQRILEYDRSTNWPDERLAMYYAEVWALLHYLTCDAEASASLGKNMAVYIQRVKAGDSGSDAFEAAFRISAKKLDKQVRRYLKAGTYESLGLPLDGLAIEQRTVTRRLAPAEIAYRLGELALLTGDVDRASELFGASLAANPNYSRAHAGLADTLKFTRRWDDAEGGYQVALDLGEDKPLNWLDAAQYWIDRAVITDDAAARQKMIRRARRYTVRSHSLDDSQAETYATYGRTFLFDGEDPAEGIESLEMAEQLLPADSTIGLWLSKAYVKTGRGDDARPILERLLLRAGNGPHRETVLQLLSEISPPSPMKEPAEASTP